MDAVERLKRQEEYFQFRLTSMSKVYDFVHGCLLNQVPRDLIITLSVMLQDLHHYQLKFQYDIDIDYTWDLGPNTLPEISITASKGMVGLMIAATPLEYYWLTTKGNKKHKRAFDNPSSVPSDLLQELHNAFGSECKECCGNGYYVMNTDYGDFEEECGYCNGEGHFPDPLTLHKDFTS